jgi:hypothetical protein
VRDSLEYAGASWTAGQGVVVAGREPGTGPGRRVRPASSFFLRLDGEIEVKRLGEALEEP